MGRRDPHGGAVKLAVGSAPHEVLGVAPNASPDEIREAVDRLSRQLAPGSLALYSAIERDEQRELLDAVQLAGTLLLARHEARESLTARAAEERSAATAPPPPLRLAGPPSETPEEVTPENAAPAAAATPGGRLRAAREAASLTLREVSGRTRIPIAQLAAIEDDDYPSLPLRAYLRGFVMTYAGALKLDPDRAWEDYRVSWESAGFGRAPSPAGR